MIDKTSYNVTFVNNSFFSEMAKPQYQNYTLLIAIVLGILMFMVVDCVVRKPEES